MSVACMVCCAVFVLDVVRENGCCVLSRDCVGYVVNCVVTCWVVFLVIIDEKASGGE